MKVVLAPDSWKGSLGAVEIAAAMAQGVRAAIPDADILLCPMADGGEGTLDVVAAVKGGEVREAMVTDANGVERNVPWLALVGETVPTAFIEVAQVVGLPDASVAVEERTTLGVGQLLRHVLDQGMRRIFLGLGGTSTNEAGIGVLAALGARFLDGGGSPVAPTLNGLARVARVDLCGLDDRLARTGLVLLTDVTNSLCGTNGATAVFGPQKGIAVERWHAVDRAVAAYAERCDAVVGQALSLAPGAGAAGGLAYALMLAGARREAGAAFIANLAGLPAMLKHAALAITGEGRSDAQTLMGKAPAIVAEYARAAGVPVVLLSGAIDAAGIAALKQHFSACHAASDPRMPLAQAMANTATLARLGAQRIAEDFIARHRQEDGNRQGGRTD